MGPDIQALMQGAGAGGPPPGPGGGGGIPPQLAALLAGAGGTGGPGGPPGPQGGSPEDKPIDILKQMIDLANNYMQAEPDEEDKATMAKLLSTLQQYLAKDQQDRDQMMGGAMNPRGIRKALA